MLPRMGQMLYIQRVTPEFELQETATLRSRLADVEPDSLYLDIPIDEKTGKLQRIEIGEELRLTYFTTDGVKHQFITRALGFRRDSVHLLAVAIPAMEEITREQRRSFLRVEAQLEIAVKLGDKLRFTALTDDVGGGGVSFRCDKKWPIKADMKAECWLLVPYRSGSVSHACFIAEAVRVVPVEPHHLLVMMRFQDIQDSDQQKIIRYCFERQLENRKD